jgi:hypothetical protein
MIALHAMACFLDEAIPVFGVLFEDDGVERGLRELDQTRLPNLARGEGVCAVEILTDHDPKQLGDSHMPFGSYLLETRILLSVEANRAKQMIFQTNLLAGRLVGLRKVHDPYGKKPWSATK